MLLWPPKLPESRKKELTTLALDWAHQNGLVVRQQAGVIHAPFALFPSPFPKPCFDLAVKLAPIYNVLVDRVSKDAAFLDEIMTK